MQFPYIVRIELVPITPDVLTIPTAMATRISRHPKMMPVMANPPSSIVMTEDPEKAISFSTDLFSFHLMPCTKTRVVDMIETTPHVKMKYTERPIIVDEIMSIKTCAADTVAIILESDEWGAAGANAGAAGRYAGRESGGKAKAGIGGGGG